MARLPRFFDQMCDSVRVRVAYRCRAYPDEAQQQVLNRTFGCVRVVWNRTLAARQGRWHLQGKTTSYAESDRALTQMKRDPDLAFLTEVSSVPLQQALRHQHQAFTAFFRKRARHPRFKSRRSRQTAHYTRSAFTLRGSQLQLAKMAAPVRFSWSWPDVDVTARRLARCRSPIPLLAFTTESATRSQLALIWGAETFLVPSVAHTDDMVRQVEAALRDIGRCADGDLVVIVAGSPPGTPGRTNALRVHRIGDAIAS
jgi:Pyruvate kinase, alpha/beta domain/Helix-turn-helix domain